MIGVFDSGRGAYNAAEYLKALLPREPLRIMTDRKNAPFGTKAREALLSILGENLHRLDKIGADFKLIACCTMSSLLPYLNEEEKRGAFGIIEPTARAAASLTKSGKIAVIATERTVAEAAFSRALTALFPSVSVSEISASPLVTIAERGGPISVEDEREIDMVCKRARQSGADTLTRQ